MATTKIYLTFIAIILFFAGCRSAEGPPFDPLETYNGSDALVFIYRPTPSYAWGGGLAPDIIIDGEKIADLSSMGYTRVFLKQGFHSLQIKRFNIDKNRRESEYEFTIPEDARRCFIRIAIPHSLSKDFTIFAINIIFSLSTKISVPLVRETAGYGSGFDMDFIDEKFALEEIKNCKYITPELDTLNALATSTSPPNGEQQRRSEMGR